MCFTNPHPHTNSIPITPHTTPHTTQGVRFNAKKVQAGSYFTTKIWEFQMKCPTCKGRIVIRTDPKNCDYDFAEGIKRREQEYDEADIGLPSLPAPGESSATAVSVDPLVALERRKDDRRKADAAAARLEELMALSERTEADNYGVNARLRQRFRGEKKAAAALEEVSLAKGLRFRLAPAEAGDADVAARALTEGEGRGLSQARRAEFKMGAKSKFAQIMGSSIFEGGGGNGGGGGGQGKRKDPPGASSALVVLKRGGAGGGVGGVSKAMQKHEAQRALAVKRAKLGINPANFRIGGGGSGSGSGAGSGSARGLPVIVRKK